MNQRPPGFLYFVQQGLRGPIKIGWTCDLEKRVATLQTGNPEPLYVLVAVPCWPDLEGVAHRVFAPYRLRGEWFSPAPQLLEYIEGCEEDYSDDQGVDRTRLRWFLEEAEDEETG